MKSSDLNNAGVRLKHARKMAGLSLQNLSDQLGKLVSKQALSKYEQGVMRPTNEVILALSSVLDVKPDYFLKKTTVDLNNITFRKKVNLSKRVEETVVEKARDYVERFLEIENILSIESNFKNPVQSLKIQNPEDTEIASENLRKSWELGNDPINNITEMLELKGVKVYLIDEVDEIDGLSFIASKNIPVVVVNTRAKSTERIRFTIVHELAHLILNFDASVKNDHKLLEILCHRFSSSFLIPSKKLIEMVGGKHRNYVAINELISIKEYSGISIRAIIFRMKQMNIITPTYYKRWMIYLSKTYGQKNEPGKYQIEEKLILFERLIARALSEELISISKAAALLNTSVNNIRKGLVGVR